MPDEIQIINPTLEQNIPLVIELTQSVLGDKSGYLLPYEIYILKDESGLERQYSLTYSVCKFIALKEAPPETPAVCYDIKEPTLEAKGSFGTIKPVVKSIIYNNGQPIFDPDGRFLIKEISYFPQEVSDSSPKPHSTMRANRREHYLASQMPKLGVHYHMIEDGKHTYIRMSRVSGFTLQHYQNRLTAEEFLSLTCALLEQIPPQAQTRILRGKHEGKTMVHCDIKLANIMAEKKDNTWNTTLIDIGLAKAMKNDHYQAKKVRGNKAAFDSQMIRGSNTFLVPLIYNAGTDLYALYIVILILAGAKSRANFEYIHQLARDLRQPNLTGLFENMDFDPETKIMLTNLITERMIIDDRTKRAPREEVLDGFRCALDRVRSSQPSKTSPAERKKVVTIEHLKNWVEINPLLGEVNKTNALRNWIREYRRLCSLINEQELSQFKNIISRYFAYARNEIKLTTTYIHNFLRFDELKEYDDVACARLLIRHQDNIDQIQTAQHHNLPQPWVNRLKRYITRLPLQLSIADAEHCLNLQDFVKLLDKVYDDMTFKHSRHYLDLLKTLSQKYLNMEFNDWVINMPRFLVEFDSHLFILMKLEETLSANSGIDHIISDIELYAIQLSQNGLNDESEQIIVDWLEIHCNLGKRIKIFDSTNESLIIKFCNQFPALNKSPYHVDNLNDFITKIDIRDELQINELNKQLDVFLTLMNIYGKLNSSLFRYGKNPEIIKQCEQELQLLICNRLGEPTIYNETNDLLDYLNLLDKADQTIRTIKDYRPYAKTIGALFVLMLEKPLLIKLTQFFENTNVNMNHFDKLEDSVRLILEQTPTERVSQRLCEEIYKYHSNSSAYISLGCSVTGNNPFALFAGSSSTVTPAPSFRLDM